MRNTCEALYKSATGHSAIGEEEEECVVFSPILFCGPAWRPMRNRPTPIRSEYCQLHPSDLDFNFSSLLYYYCDFVLF
ncbi:hypothetical protein ANANG_G00131400 [Anguilla anguilla]|uniref:Uncharacterized protein n=1 Tax=Anguilla anguilla TaxID=7936 RepID=A0A9D3MFA0_ANGAN|nr:hypothetical protein ANANG_G00131400 [Anguilla anguilla]